MLTEKEILSFIDNEKSKANKVYALTGINYYKGLHDIRNYGLFYYDSNGNLVNDTMRSNIKISHPFFTQLVDQQVQYILSGDRFFLSDESILQKYLDYYFNENEDFLTELYDVITGAIIKGSEYMYAYKNAKNKLSFQCADSLCVCEVDGKYSSDGKAYYIYYYDEQGGNSNTTVRKIQVWDSEQTWFYTLNSKGKLIFDKQDRKNDFYNPRPHIVYSEKGEKLTGGLGFIPFFRLDNNKDKMSDLKNVKEIIDDYDLMSCGLSNNLQDASEYLVVVKGFQGDNLDELINNVKTKKHIGVDGGGDLDFKTVNVPYEARQAKLQLDEDNIYRFGMGFNSCQTGDGNITNIVIKSRYSLLDLKCNKLEIRLKQFLRKLIVPVISEINSETGGNWSADDVYFNFERKIITNSLDNASIELTEAQRRQTEISTYISLENVLGHDAVVNNIYRILDINNKQKEE